MPETLIVSDPFPVSYSSGQSRKLLQQSLTNRYPDTIALKLVAAHLHTTVARVVKLLQERWPDFSSHVVSSWAPHEAEMHAPWLHKTPEPWFGSYCSAVDCAPRATAADGQPAVLRSRKAG